MYHMQPVQLACFHSLQRYLHLHGVSGLKYPMKSLGDDVFDPGAESVHYLALYHLYFLRMSAEQVETERPTCGGGFDRWTENSSREDGESRMYKQRIYHIDFNYEEKITVCVRDYG